MPLVKKVLLQRGLPQELNSKGDEELDELSKLTTESQITLFKVKTVFPFTFFPDTLVIDLFKINIIRKTFYLSERIISVEICDVLNVDLIYGPLFATLKISTKFFTQKPISLSFLRKKDAVKARRIITGLLIAYKNNIPIDQINKKDLLENLISIGKIKK